MSSSGERVCERVEVSIVREDVQKTEKRGNDNELKGRSWRRKDKAIAFKGPCYSCIECRLA